MNYILSVEYPATLNDVCVNVYGDPSSAATLKDLLCIGQNLSYSYTVFGTNYAADLAALYPLSDAAGLFTNKGTFEIGRNFSNLEFPNITNNFLEVVSPLALYKQLSGKEYTGTNLVFVIVNAIQVYMDAATTSEPVIGNQQSMSCSVIFFGN